MERYGIPLGGLAMTAMVAPFVAASSSPVHLGKQAGTEIMHAKPAINCGAPFDLLAIKRKLPAQWMAFLRAHFRSAYEVQVTFGVTENTALNWWSGKFAPHASAALAVASVMPEAARFLIGRAA
jgi:hypothetical protein